jgi:hypothetical protein
MTVIEKTLSIVGRPNHCARGPAAVIYYGELNLVIYNKYHVRNEGTSVHSSQEVWLRT